MRCLVQNLTAVYQLHFPLDKACILPVASLSDHQKRWRTAPCANTEIQSRMWEQCTPGAAMINATPKFPFSALWWDPKAAGLSAVNLGANDLRAGIFVSYPLENCHRCCSEVRKLLIHLRNCQRACKEMSDGGFGKVLGQETPAVRTWFLIWTNREQGQRTAQNPSVPATGEALQEEMSRHSLPVTYLEYSQVLCATVIQSVNVWLVKPWKLNRFAPPLFLNRLQSTALQQTLDLNLWNFLETIMLSLLKPDSSSRVKDIADIYTPFAQKRVDLPFVERDTWTM